MSGKINMIGYKNEFLEVIEELPYRKSDNRTSYRCKCSCGNLFEATGKSIRNGSVKSCGCYRNKILKSQGFKNVKHNETKSNLYNIWRGIKKRCRLKSNISYIKYYGSKNIDVCDDWFNDYIKFKNWSLKNGYEKGLTIDRIDNDKGYYPENCRWVNWKTQENNRKNNKRFIYLGNVYTQSQLSEKLGISTQLFNYRLKRGIYKVINNELIKDE
jgi:deoxyuridine 5'-triphosphate nucleotidohydrolase family protein